MVSTYLALLASMIQLLGFALYDVRIFTSATHPNIASWSIWTLVTAVNFTSYRSMTKDWAKSLLPTVSWAANIVTFAMIAFTGDWSALSIFDKLAIGFGALAVLAWKLFGSATYANLIMQGCIAIGFIPLYLELAKNPRTETPLPWLLWSLAYVLAIIVVRLRWRKQYQDLAYPVCNLGLHFTVALLAMRI